MTMVRREEELGTREALTLRVAELSTVCKQQRDEIEEQRSVLEMSRKQLRNHEEIIRIMEAQLIERDAQLASIKADDEELTSNARNLLRAHPLTRANAYLNRDKH